MDELAGLLDGPRARGAFLLRTLLRPPWAIRVADEAPLSLTAVLRGEAYVLCEGAEPVRMGPGDVAVVRWSGPYTVAGAPGTPVRVVIDADQKCHTLYGEPLWESMALGVRTWGDGEDAPTEMLVGTYLVEGEVSRRLTDVLPQVAHVPAGSWDSPLLPMLAEEIGRDEPGQEVVLDRVLDLLLITALRSWFAGQRSAAPAWYRARADPVVGRAVRLLHADPGRAWTVAGLAGECGVSRAALARRFTALVGEAPIAYLTGLRLATAADLLRGSDAPLSSIARKVGYSTPFALSSAFKRAYGVSPTEHRARAADR
ncbi:AraC family transcriptional regulator [Nocardiopsis sp. CNT-189]|uniref:AraC family transcriptional regulator n=1 Tax=Nocardiopsis oceanisediminis TaxID=2816862 RepID=UPI003B30E64D